MSRCVLAGCFLTTLTCVAVGCRPEEGIRTYSIPKEVPPVSAAKTQSQEAGDRMLVAIVPHGNDATFFKLTGPIEQVDSITGDVKNFVESLTVADGGAPTWKLPDGWREEAGNEFRRATILVPAGNTTLELAVSQLPWQQNDDYLLSNINRWRGQMQLSPIQADQLAQSYETIKSGDTQVIWLDLSGTSSGTMPQFAPRSANQ
jgi:hypothetical protein